MNQIEERAKAAIIGSFVADAAGQPLHWVYSSSKIDETLKGTLTPEFAEWICPFYKLETGSFSVYADQAYVLLQSIVENNGFNLAHFAKATGEHFGHGTPYDMPHSKEALPKQGPWRNGHLTKSLANISAGKVDGGADAAESDAVAIVAPLIALYAGSDELTSVVEKAIRVTLNNECSVNAAQFYAKLLEHYILHGKDDEGLRKVLNSFPDSEFKKEWQIAYDERDLPMREAAKKYGIACALPGNFKGALNCVGKNLDYVTAVRTTMSSIGATAPRLCVVGACTAAQEGLKAIPDDWISKTIHGRNVVELATKLVELMKK